MSKRKLAESAAILVMYTGIAYVLLSDGNLKMLRARLTFAAMRVCQHVALGVGRLAIETEKMYNVAMEAAKQ